MSICLYVRYRRTHNTWSLVVLDKNLKFNTYKEICTINHA